MKQKVLAIFKGFITPAFWKSLVVGLVHAGPTVATFLYMFVTFFILLVFFSFSKIIGLLESIPYIGKPFRMLRSTWNKTAQKYVKVFMVKLDGLDKREVRRSFLIETAFKNLLTKKTRTIITIFGMSVGIGIIVLLLSFGYGIERLIIGQVASLDELKIIDVSTGANTALHLNNNVMNKIKKIHGVGTVIPLVSTVGRVALNKANTDVLVYAAPNEYIQYSNIKLLQGKFFADNKANKYFSYSGGEVAGAQTSEQKGYLGKEISSETVVFNVIPGKVALAYKTCSDSSDPVGYVVRVEEGSFQGKEYWGAYYKNPDVNLGAYDTLKSIYVSKWIQSRVLLYQKNNDGTYSIQLDDQGSQDWHRVCMREGDLQVIHRYNFGSVLGIATDSAALASDTTATASADTTTSTATDSALLTDQATVVSTGSGGIEYVSLASSSAKAATVNTLSFSKTPSGQAVVSSGFLSLLGISPRNAIGTKFNVSFIVSKTIVPKVDGKASTKDVAYSIIGVMDDPQSQYFYIPLSDMIDLGAQNYSQMKVVLESKNDLTPVRRQIENLGFTTSSTADTVNQIQSLFANLRLLLGLLGLVALGVASLGMFNTMTVSLLERTREIGGMKTMGMVSEEVRDLFLAEAMIMGLSGGIGGLFLGLVAGKGISFLVSLVALSRGQGYLDLTYIPVFLTVFILISSFVVGLMTGVYPAYRARKISALNALRYE